MQSIFREALKAFLSGLTISTLFFFPLLNVLSGNNFEVLHWNSQDTTETLLSWLILGTLIGGLFFFVNRKGNQYVTAFFYALMIEIGGFFAVGALIRKIELINALKSNQTIVYTIATIVALFLIALTAWISTTSNACYSKIPKRVLIILAPLNILMVFNLSIAQSNIPTKIPHSQSEIEKITLLSNQRVKPLTVIILFDELSPDYLYGSRQVDMAKLPVLKELLDNSNIFTNAHLPGGATAEAIPALFQHEYHGGSLKDLVISEESKASVTGWFLDYCHTFLKQASNCRSVSFFNARTLDDQFSLLHPIWTNLNLLPYQKPFGFIKIPAATAMHVHTLAKINGQLHDDLNNPNLNLIYTHFNIPHIPMIGARNFSWADGGRFDESELAYINQLKYVDKVIGLAKDQLNLMPKKRPVNLIILSDHNIRNLTPKSEHENTVLIFQPSVELESPPNPKGDKVNSAEVVMRIMEKIDK
jgi:hypothetical protein